jgi:hypothetical protein
MRTIKYFAALILFITATQLQAKPMDVRHAINQAVKNYLDLKNSLASDDSKGANDAAKKFTDALKDISPDQMNANQKQAWEQYGEKLRFDGEHISESNDIAHQREHFGSLSANLYSLLKSFKDNDAALYQQYCPMAKKYWLSESSTIKNPYYGKKMSDCGVTKETLKAAKPDK